MSSPKLLSSLLPYTFANGVTIRRFSKACPKCGHMLESKNMRGLVVGMQDNLYIAAHANCPYCHHTFSVCCIVTDTKQVVKVPFPVYLMKQWIRWSLKKRAHNILNNNQTSHTMEIEEEEMPLPPKPKSLTNDDVEASQEIIGYLGSLAIIAHFNYKEKCYYFERVVQSAENLTLTEHEKLFLDVLIYSDENKR